MARTQQGIPLPEITFARKDPQTYVILVTRAGPEGVLLGTQHFKPLGCEFATEQDMYEAGYVRAEAAVAALAMLGDDDRGKALRAFMVSGDPEKRAVTDRIAGALLEDARERGGL